jgi:glycosyltransferase involved in cell wall biosynthesis
MNSCVKCNKSSCIAVVIPIYNPQLGHLREAIESVIKQKESYCELILVIDQDDNLELVSTLKKMDIDRLNIIVQSNQGQSTARNLGIKIASSKFVALLDQDDFWEPRHLEKVVKVLTLNPEIGLVYTAVKYVDEFGYLRSVVDAATEFPYWDIKGLLRQNLMIWPSSMALNKELITGVVEFRGIFRGYEDDDFIIQCFRNHIGFEVLSKSHTVNLREHTLRHSHTNEMLENAKSFYLTYLELATKEKCNQEFAIRFFPTFAKLYQHKRSAAAKKELIDVMKKIGTSRMTKLSLILEFIPNKLAILVFELLIKIRGR